MNSELANRTIPLAAAIQSLLQVREIATSGHYRESVCTPIIHTLFTLDQGDLLKLYGGVTPMIDGLRHLERMLGGAGRSERDPEMTRYLVGALHLEGKLNRSRATLSTVSEAVSQLSDQATERSPLDPELLASIDAIYQQSISPLGPRIMVAGEPHFLNQEQNRHLIRALLLSAIRALLLWRHYGGGKWQLLFQRRRYIDGCRQLLAAV